MCRFSILAMAAATAVSIINGQTIERRAQIGRGGGPGGEESCSLTVMVDGVAEVEIRGDHAVLRNVSGQPPQFRAFECSRPIPPNAPGLRFIAESGRGRQEMAREYREGGPVIVHIEDHDGGAGEYRFRIAWGGRGEHFGDRDRPVDRPADRGGDRNDDGYAQERERFFRGEGWRRNLFQRVREDVEHVERSAIPFTGDRQRLNRTISELNELQGKLSQGRYDERQLDDVVNALRTVVDENKLMSRGDRDALSDDLNRLREFRARHDDYGARRPRY
jgi:hypothetical protein